MLCAYYEYHELFLAKQKKKWFELIAYPPIQPIVDPEEEKLPFIPSEAIEKLRNLK